jgi:hypothetical protein
MAPVSTQAGAAQRATAGWYPDPLGPPGQLRWWDGSGWTSSVQSPSAPRPGTAETRESPRRKRRTIGWAALGAFALGVTGIFIAVVRGQDVCAVSATGVEFCERDDATLREVEEGQARIETQASELQSQAQAQDAAPTAPGTADLTGTWVGDNGFTYVIEQYGDQAVISEVAFDGMKTAVGSGTVEGSDFTFDFQAFDGSVGTGSLERDGNTLTGSFDNILTGLSTPLVLTR